MPAVYKALRDARPNQSVTTMLQRITRMSIQELDTQWRSDINSRDFGNVDTKWSQLRNPIERYIRNMPKLQNIQ